MSETKLQIDCPKCGEPVFVSEHFKAQAARITRLESTIQAAVGVLDNELPPAGMYKASKILHDALEGE